MGLARYYLPDLAAGDYSFSSEEARHITGAKRHKVGDVFEVFDGMGRFAKVRIAELKSRRLLVEPTSEVRYEERGLPEIEIAVAVPKGKRLQYMIEKLAELGVSRVVPVVFERSVAGGDDPVQKYTRWAVEACKQSRNLWIPEFSKPVAFSEYIGGVSGCVLMADYTGGSILDLYDNMKEPVRKFTCLIGPEGGFSEVEFELVENAGIQKINLAPNVLRIETAAVAFAGVLMALRK